MFQFTNEVFTKKRLIIIAVCLFLVVATIFSACYWGNEYNRPYKKVRSVYAEGYDDFEAYSEVMFLYDEKVECSQAEYDAWVSAGAKYYSNTRIASDGKLADGTTIRQAKKAVGTCMYGKTQEYNYSTNRYEYKYYKVCCTDVIVSYVYVKFVNEDTIRVKYKYGRNVVVSQMKFDNYLIEYFN